jgi:hypothetical protein
MAPTHRRVAGTTISDRFLPYAPVVANGVVEQRPVQQR